MHDVSNNLKLYRHDVVRELEITEPGFAANAEIGIQPLLAKRDILEVPIGTVMSRLHRGRKALEKALWETAKERGFVDA